MKSIKSIFTFLIITSFIVACEPSKDKNESKAEEIAEEVSAAFQVRKDKLQDELLILKDKIDGRMDNAREDLKQASEAGEDSTIVEIEKLNSRLSELRLELDATADAIENSTKENLDDLEDNVEELTKNIEEALSEDSDTSEMDEKTE